MLNGGSAFRFLSDLASCQKGRVTRSSNAADSWGNGFFLVSSSGDLGGYTLRYSSCDCCSEIPFPVRDSLGLLALWKDGKLREVVYSARNLWEI